MKGFFYVSLLLGILKEVTRSSLKQNTDSDGDVAALFDTVQKVFQKMLECVAWNFRKQPEEGLRVLASSQGGTVRHWVVALLRRPGVPEYVCSAAGYQHPCVLWAFGLGTARYRCHPSSTLASLLLSMAHSGT